MEASVEQRFCNHGRENAELVYTFPLPWGAVLLGIDVALAGQHLTGRVVEKHRASSDYEEALSEGHAAILLEVLDDGDALDDEASVVAAFTHTVAILAKRWKELARRASDPAFPAARAPTALVRRMEHALHDMTLVGWPAAVLALTGAP